MNSKEYINEVVLRTCSGSGRNLDDLIAELRALDAQTGGRAAPMLLAGIGIGGEAGEVTDLVKKLAFHGKPYTKEIRDLLVKELGDVLWYAGVLCYVLDIDFEQTMQLNKEKLELRYPDGFSTQAAEARVDAVLSTNT